MMAVELATLALALDARGMKTGAEMAGQAVLRLDQTLRVTLDDLRKTEAQAKKTGSAFGGMLNSLRLLAGGYLGFRGLTLIKDQLVSIDRALADLAVGSGLDRASDQFKELEQTARRFGVASGAGSIKATQGLTAFVKAGYDAEQAAISLGAALDLSRVSGLEVGNAADVIVQTLGQFGLGVSQTARVLDVMAKAADSSAADLASITESMRNVGPVASDAGLDIEQVAAAIGVLSNSAQIGARAGTGLRGAILSILDPTAETLKVIESLGLRYEDVDLQGESLIDVFKRLRDAGINTTDAARIFGQEYAVVATALTKSIDKVEELDQVLRNSNGELRRQSKIIGDTLGGDIDKLNAAFQELTNTMGDAGLLGLFRELTQAATGFVNALSGNYGAGGGFGFGEAMGAAANAAANSLERLGFELADGKISVEEFKASFRGQLTAEIDKAIKSYDEFNAKIKAGTPNAPRENAPRTGRRFETAGTGAGTERAQDRLSAIEEELRQRKLVIEYGREEAEILKEVGEFREAAIEVYGQEPEIAERMTEHYERQLRILNDQEKAAEKVRESAQGIADAIGDPLRSNINSAIRTALEGGDLNFREFGKKLGIDILSGLLDELVVSRLVTLIKQAIIALVSASTGGAGGLLAGLLLEKGGVISGGGSIQAFAKGASFAGGHVTRGPEVFPMANGYGLRGEAGPEAVIPLKRGGDGVLGVQVKGGGMGRGGVVNYFISTPDAESFRKSEQHIRADNKRRERRFER